VITDPSAGRTDVDAKWWPSPDHSGTPVGLGRYARSRVPGWLAPGLRIAPAMTTGAHLLGLPPWSRTHSLTGMCSPASTDHILGMITEVFTPVLVEEEAEDDELDTPSLRSLALNAVDSLRRWLGFNDEQVAELVGIAPRSIPNWRNSGRDPYPSTVRQLFEVHNLLAALVRRLGLPETTVWLAEPVDDGSNRLDLLRAERVDVVLRHASALLFPVLPSGGLRVDDDEDDEVGVTVREDFPKRPTRSRGARASRTLR